MEKTGVEPALFLGASEVPSQLGDFPEMFFTMAVRAKDYAFSNFLNDPGYTESAINHLWYCIDL